MRGVKGEERATVIERNEEGSRGSQRWRDEGREGGRVIDGGEDGQGVIMWKGRGGRGAIRYNRTVMKARLVKQARREGIKWVKGCGDSGR